ncbi:hypothetical protein BV25DRAFT_1821888 [Artomyces pyxidatus]|uniref:Uncharacterized protein n=1 Tax=Artomyces pyxidatus TaxID=48021 RepID=A0ACB8TBS7_9AGAM|nr:hypothetical protein BV25DRAFT_1821888 [Artomyces pyxidatus]
MAGVMWWWICCSLRRRVSGIKWDQLVRVAGSWRLHVISTRAAVLRRLDVLVAGGYAAHQLVGGMRGHLRAEEARIADLCTQDHPG